MLFSTVTKLSIKPKAPFLEDETTKGILCRTSGKGSEMLQSGDTMFTLVAVVLGEVLARSRIDWDLHPFAVYKGTNIKGRSQGGVEDQTRFL